jgi:hypothetical protein
VLRTFLDWPQAPRARARAFLTSVVAHAALALLLLFLVPAEMQPVTPLAMALPISLAEPPPADAAGGGAPAAAEPETAPAAPRRKRAAVPVTVTTMAEPAPVPESEVEVPEPASDAPAEAAPEALPVVAGGEGGGVGSGIGDGVGSGVGSGEAFDVGERGVRRRREELAGRVIGEGPSDGPAGATRGLPYVSLREATTLRTYDFFPRLPAALWQSHRPYVVAVDLCVSEDGQVTEASLLGHRSSQLDPVVLDAVRTWRYHPRVVEGQPSAFCHVVNIKYERY